MTDIELSLMSNVYTADSLERSLQELASQTGVKYHSQFLTWGNAWTELVRVALYGHGPDVSEIGTTWVGDLVGMNSLHPFSHAEIDTIGGADTYLKGAWQSGLVGQDNQVWSIPWLADTRLIYYRRDLLAKAGISEAGAFASHAAIKDTLQKLVDFGVCRCWHPTFGGPAVILLTWKVRRPCSTCRKPALLSTSISSWANTWFRLLITSSITIQTLCTGKMKPP
jgi:multiple sugar transport system substrate-binding protein